MSDTKEDSRSSFKVHPSEMPPSSSFANAENDTSVSLDVSINAADGQTDDESSNSPRLVIDFSPENDERSSPDIQPPMSWNEEEALPSTSGGHVEVSSAADMNRPGEGAEVSNQRQEVTAIEKPWVCSFCMAQFASEAGLKKHKEVAMIDGKHKCPECEKCFKYASLLRSHYVRHSGEKPFECRVCRQKFARKPDLNTHEAGKHSDRRPFRCRQCGADYKYAKALSTHVRKKHPVHGTTATK
ncbi:hypothetical protein MRX96_014972 [Rhipicephalus microplus]|nr:gastrula zinc finger protein XlCGF7.1-like [Rhipicephalus microplus]